MDTRRAYNGERKKQDTLPFLKRKKKPK